MRIFQVIGSSTNGVIKNNQTWYRNLYEPLIELGHDVVLFKIEEDEQAVHLYDTQIRARFSEKLEKAFSNSQTKTS